MKTEPHQDFVCTVEVMNTPFILISQFTCFIMCTIKANFGSEKCHVPFQLH
uniref:Uncharacterized protein n=1 Tax=Arundo donax TaxID=35708 RepID=A0A0A9A3V6_ARUDO